jgi:hypothetical protein
LVGVGEKAGDIADYRADEDADALFAGAPGGVAG